MGSHRAEHAAPQRARRADHASAPTCEIPTVTTEVPRSAPGGQRRALKHVGRARTPLPWLRTATGLTVLALAAGGVVTAPEIANTVAATDAENRVAAASALSGSDRAGIVGTADRGNVVSRNSDREAGSNDLVAKAAQQTAEREAKLGQLAEAAQREAGEIVANTWVSPLSGYRLTASFGEVGLWASSHTGLDFAASYGAPIRAVAGGTVTEVGYDGSYGNKTVITLEDGTELWYAHQSSYAVSTGEEVRAGEVIGEVGSTGNSTGAHLHLEVRPGGGDPVDPYAALVQNGVQP